MSIKDRIITILLKGIPFGGLMIIYDHLKADEISWIKFGILSLLFGITLSFTDPIKNFKLKNLFGSKSDYLRLSVFVILGQLIALILKMSMNINSFAVLLLASSLLFLGSHKNKTVPNTK